MNRDTFEIKDIGSTPLETYEWEDIWWEHADDNTTPRVLIIGDSISRGYRPHVNRMLGGDIHVDGIATSKSIDNPYYAKTIEMTIEQSRCDLILINNGLHGWHLDADSYKKSYESIIHMITEKFPNVKVSIVLTTPERDGKDHSIIDEKQDKIIRARNDAARDIAKKYGLNIIDLYELLIGEGSDLWTDIVHLKTVGYEKIAAVLVDHIRNNI